MEEGDVTAGGDGGDSDDSDSEPDYLHEPTAASGKKSAYFKVTDDVTAANFSLRLNFAYYLHQ